MHLSQQIIDVLNEMTAMAEKTADMTNDKWLLARSLKTDSARLLAILTKAINAQTVLEIGTSVGYSTIHLALAVQETGGHVTTLELLPAKFAAAEANLARAGLSDYVTQHQGDALELLRTLPGPWDLIFLDVEKELYEDAWHAFKENVRPGGLVVADNVRSHAEDLNGYLNAIRADARFDTVTVPIGQGLEVSARRR